ncbi:ATP synthase F0F1 subunit delta [Methylacidiphilum kamchatkense Kam1]|uniref:ATP synthase F0F1 subunit delta n=1 Tax=Methylacidiphilum kamchatkense Kam1 TaxID=1202785 RepID=A0A0C1RKC7_9BACT|nr:F0F1 ATP synthase subunit delta [Methylacidiphilum kamchatkense]KIE58512.1 ATP synthase F0F1 subunit delta [Methylacidiphilum kamchatkense Kam1]QDQ43329.1 F-type H+-transporting ATPase subunit delta [Methylacidiphilum kamchatkense Kam1]
MKISREAKRQAKALFRFCQNNGSIDEEKLKEILNKLAQEKPRHYLEILEWLKQLLANEVAKKTYVVQSAAELPDQGKSIFEKLEKSFGPALEKKYQICPELIGGVRIQVGCDVWDGSIAYKLKNIETLLSK